MSKNCKTDLPASSKSLCSKIFKSKLLYVSLSVVAIGLLVLSYSPIYGVVLN